MKSSTSGRKQSRRRHKPALQLRFVRLLFSTLGEFFPSLLGRWAYHTWFATRRFKTPAREQAWIAGASMARRELAGIPVMTYRWGDQAKPLVVLLHGWNGRGSQVAAFAAPLVQAGYQVFSYDAPGHGHSPGNSSNIFEMSEVLKAIADQVAPIHGIVAHSFAGMVTALALSRGLPAKRVVLISTPARFDFLVEIFAHALRIPVAVRNNLVERLKARFGDRMFDEVSTQTTCQQLGHIAALIIQDEKDHDLPVEQAEQIHHNWPGSELWISTGLGHRRILYNERVIQQVVAFISRDD